MTPVVTLTPSAPPEITWPAIAAVVLLAALAALAHWWLKGRGLIPSAANPIRVVATRSLGGKRAIAIVEVEHHRFLLGLTDDAVSCLSTLPSEAKAIGSSSVVALPLGVAR
jgi:flagellar biogenesis protein FliO